MCRFLLHENFVIGHREAIAQVDAGWLHVVISSPDKTGTNLFDVHFTATIDGVDVLTIHERRHRRQQDEPFILEQSAKVDGGLLVCTFNAGQTGACVTASFGEPLRERTLGGEDGPR